MIVVFHSSFEIWECLGFDVDVVVDVDVFVTAIWGILIMDQQMLWQDLAWLPLHLGSEPNKTGAPPGSE